MGNNVYQVITDRIIDSLQKGTVPWRQTWSNGGPINLVSKKHYRGVNTFLLGCAGYSSPYWLTYKQAIAKKGNVRKGEKSTPCIFYSKITKEDANGKDKTFGMLRFYNVFNVEQCDGIVAPEINKVREFTPIESCKRIMSGYVTKPRIDHGGSRACYSPSSDVISMPSPGSFDTAESYYATLFHEAIHSSGAKFRLDREGITNPIVFGSHDYSFEELIAECGSAFLCGTAGIENATLENSVSYIASWMKKLRSEPRWIVEAANQASKASDYILGIKKDLSEDEAESS